MQLDLYNLLPYPDKNDEADPDLKSINPHDILTLNNVLCKARGKGISHCNIRSLSKNLTLLNDMLNSIDSRPDIHVIAVTETRF